MFFSFQKKEQPQKSQERRRARLIHESSCFESFLLILTHSCELFKAQLSEKSKSSPVSCCLLEKREKREMEELLFCKQETHRNVSFYHFRWRYTSTKEKTTIHLERRLQLTNLNVYLPICPQARTWKIHDRKTSTCICRNAHGRI